MSDFPTYRPGPTEPRFHKLRVILWHLWPLLLVFIVGILTLLVVAFPGSLARFMPTPAEIPPPVVSSATQGPDSLDASATGGTTSLWVDSDPVGAGVLVDGDSVGVTPIMVPEVLAGLRRVTVRVAGYAPVDTLIDAQASTPIELWIPLQRSSGSFSYTSPGGTPSPLEPPPAPPPPTAPSVQPEADAQTGRIEILARPWGDIYIDGALARSQTDVLYQTELPVGRHRIRVAHPALGSQERVVIVAPGAPQRVTFDLGPSPGDLP